MKLLDGYTLMHEHITIDLSRIKKDSDTKVDIFDETIKEFKKLYHLGLRNILDVTNIGMGRNIEYVKKVQEATGIQILQSTGFYKEPFLPKFVYNKSKEELADFMLKEIVEGIEGTNVKAKCIGEIGTSKGQMTKEEKKIFDASVLAAKKSGALISTHTTLGTYGYEQVCYFMENEIDVNRIIIGHMDLSKNLSYIEKVLATGVTIGFDTIGKNNYFPDEERAKFLYELQEKGYMNQIVLSLDITRKTNFEYLGGIGYAYLFTVFVPLLKKNGVTEESINKMLIENPKRLLTY